MKRNAPATMLGLPATWPLLAVLALGACHKADAASARVTDLHSARAVAEAVAERADCRGFEDYDLTKKGRWDFTCQRGDRMFLVRSVATAADKAATISELRASSEPFMAGRDYVVWSFKTPGRENEASALKGFEERSP